MTLAQFTEPKLLVPRLLQQPSRERDYRVEQAAEERRAHRERRLVRGRRNGSRVYRVGGVRRRHVSARPVE